ncbi:MAG: RBBP9/YdeN family alpha/beta hydrolase [Burkholderiaceae bacterium]
MKNVLVLPGYGGSGPQHWQTLWETADPALRRVRQRDWDRPDRDEWCAALEAAVREAGPQTILVAHSMGCLVVAHWAARTALRAAGALLVAVPDPDGLNFPAEATGFRPLPRGRLPFPSIVAASADDPYADLAFARRCASDWGSRFVDVGRAGHVNAASGLGDWPRGRALLEELAA